MSLAFEKAGYRILVVCENDKKACDVYKKYMKSNIVYDDVTKIDIHSLPDADVIAGKLEIHDNNNSQKNAKNNVIRKMELLPIFLEAINWKTPKAILCEVNASAVNTKSFHDFMLELSSCYKVSYKLYNVNEITNMPVNERKMYIVGIRKDISENYNFMTGDKYQQDCYTEILEYESVDKWYFKINYNQIKYSHKKDGIKNGQFYCWKDNGYVECENVKWNTVKIPLVNVNGEVRKLTHREIARLKGYPEDFYFDISNKAWLYSKLMYASNVSLLYLIIHSLGDVLKDRLLLNQQVTRAIRFEKLFGEFLERHHEVRKNIESRNTMYDFAIKKNGVTICFELKLYADRFVNNGNVLRICERLNTQRNSEEKIVLVFGNELDEQIKHIVKEKYNIEIWDIENLLYLFREFPEINNEFIALLNYTINDIEPKSPKFNIVNDNIEDISQNDLLVRLDRIIPGQAESSAYEHICVEILKYVFGENLSLWREQQKSNNGLYRFDLCCKIKHGDNHEFFDTLRDFFNTKYIVFEFKNYSNLITQSEIYTTEKYLYKTALRCVAIIISRKGADNNAIIASKGCLRENGKLILCLSDEDLHNLVDLKRSEEKPTAEVLSDMLDDMLINLEK